MKIFNIDRGFFYLSYKIHFIYYNLGSLIGTSAAMGDSRSDFQSTLEAPSVQVLVSV
jgi:hypothetical protein